MAPFILVYLLLFYLNSEANSSTPHPRLTFTTGKETIFKRSDSPAYQAPVRILLRDLPDLVTAVGQTHLSSYNFQSSQKNPAEGKVQWSQCSGADCDYKMNVVQQRENSTLVFVCGTNGKEALCCDMNISESSPSCVSHEKIRGIKESIEGFIDKESKHSILVESEHSTDLYVTYSGSQDRVGFYKFGSKRVLPGNHDKEQHYAGLVPSRRRDDPSQNRVYAFYKQKNRDTELDSEMWTSFVTQVCMSDDGGPKNYLQFRWTSQLNARLFCGDRDRKQLFSELVDTATVQADHWGDTKIYGLFRNEWGMSAVCVYTLRDIDNVFMKSPLKGQSADRPRNCVEESSKIPSDVLRVIDKASDMEYWVQPVNWSDPLLFSHFNYTHISVDSFQQRDSLHTVMFLSLNSGRIHKVVQSENETFIVAEYRPFKHHTHIDNLILRTSSKKLYVHSRHELVQVDVADCSQYGTTCQDCILSRDPYCGWKHGICTSNPRDALQDVARGDPARCQAPMPHTQGLRQELSAPGRSENTIGVPFQSRYFLACPVSSHHAQYTWKSPDHTRNCSSRDDQCVFLIHSMNRELEGLHECVSEEQGYHKVLAQYQLRLEGGASRLQSGLVFWVCLLIALMRVSSW